MICGLFLLPLATFSQHTIKGTITDESGTPIYGASIRLKDTYYGALTDPEGVFALKDIDLGLKIVEIKAPGYEPIERSIEVKDDMGELTFQLQISALNLKEIMVIETRATDRTPTTYTNLDQKQIEKSNFGQDIPMLLGLTTSAVSSSDAGAGIGYTGIRIRGVDPTRTNVTVNGIPLNDAESHGVFWVNMPDFASSVQSIQVQRGVGTSANGAAAFGASINIDTKEQRPVPYAELDNGFGSFNTFRHTIKAGTGLMNNKFSVNTRVSKIASEGYIDRASADLKAFYIDGTWQGKKSSVTANIFTGKETTYQAWYGTPESVINGDPAAIEAYADRNYIYGADRENLLNSGRTYNFYTYDNEVDDYQQDHYQLHFSHRFNAYWKLNLKGHYTRGAGYYEQYRADDDFADYGLAPIELTSDTISNGDFIRRRWLDNHFYGGIFSVNYQKGMFDIVVGGGVNEYVGDHFGEIIWSEFASNSNIRDRYYDNTGSKFEAQTYAKTTVRKNRTTYFLDLQYRHIAYEFLGIDEVNGELEELTQQVSYDFFNPKIGFMVDFDSKNNVYASMAIANREPVRSDFRENTPENRPKHEELIDLEVGYRYKAKKLFVNANVFYMQYENQLVLTGQINDVGGYTRTNAEDSYRGGLELEAGYLILKNLSVAGNLALSANKILVFNEYLDNYDTGVQDIIEHQGTDLAFSPNVIGSVALNYQPIDGLDLGWTSKYVSSQFLDNTSSTDRMLDAYFFSNFQVSYTLKDVLFKEMTFGIQVNNIFNELYENNGYTWGYVYGGARTQENFYYPQAGRNIMTRLTIKL